MDAYEATRVVFSRIQALDPDNAAKIMGLLLIQDHGEKEMIRLAFGPESLLHSVVLKARKDLGLLPASTPSSPSSFLLPRLLAGAPPPQLAVTSPSSWAPLQPFSRATNNGDEMQNPGDEFISPTNPSQLPFYGGGDLIDEFQLQDQLSFLNDGATAPNIVGSSKPGDVFYPDDCRSPGSNGDPYGMNWGVNGHHHHRRNCSITDLCLGSDPAGFGWRPCLYFARGYCKNGTSCRFLHGLPDDTKMDSAVEQQCHELLLRSKSQRLMISGAGAGFPYTPTGSVPPSPSSKCMSFLLQQQQNDNQRAAAAAAALMLGGDETHKFLGRSRSDFAGLVNPGSRQIYLTFPADSTFREEDVSNYFSIYGPVQDVRIPYQQKRMFGFVTFVYPETVKLILAKGNPHFVCDSRVLVKPYKEKGKVPDKKHLQQQQAERGDFSGCNTPTGHDLRDPYDLHLGSRMMFGNCSSPDLLLRRKLEEQQQQAELQQAIEMQGRRFMGLQLLDLKSRSLSSSSPSVTTANISPATMSSTSAITTTLSDARSNGGSPNGSPPIEKSLSCAALVAGNQELLHQAAVNSADKEESGGETKPNVDSDFQESNVEHNLPDNPFASPTKSSIMVESSMAAMAEASAPALASNSSNHLIASPLLPATSTLDMASFKSCFFQMPRFSSGHGAIGM